MKLRPWKNLERKMKCGPSFCGKAHNQIRQRRRPTRKKRVWISPYTLFSSAAYVARMAVHFVPALALSGSGEPVVLVLGVAALHYNTSFRQLLQQATGHHRSGNVQTDFG